MSAEKIPVLLIGLEPESEKAIEDLLKNTKVQKVPLDMDQVLKPMMPSPAIIIAGSPKAEVAPNELAQALRMQYPDSLLYICSIQRAGFERKSFIKNGFNDAFLLPMDISTLRGILSDTLAKMTSGQIQVFRPVKIIDVAPGSTLDFDTSVFLPANNRYVKLSTSGDSLDQAKIDRMKKNKFNSVYVPAEQMNKFYEYTAKRLKNIGNGAYSVTEKKEKLAVAVRDLISGLFTEQSASFESGQGVLKDCGEIVKTFILQGADTEWYSRILTILGERGDSYSHSGNTSTLAALFSMGLGVGRPEDMALAGLLHDIGTAELPAEIQALEPADMTKAQFELYKKHPEYSVALIKSRKIIVPEIVTKAILQHHELYNGTGYPSGIFGDRICKEAQVLALANNFDYLTRLHEGKPMMTPAEAVEKLRSEQVNDPSKIHYNPELLKKLLTLFPAPNGT
jgi:HD-GYP domain-containing protein (c-di-GMP phosphodiesterase class II)